MEVDGVRRHRDHADHHLDAGWRSNCTWPTPTKQPAAPPSGSVAVCLTGLLRALLSHVVIASYRGMVRAPLLARGHVVDPFIVLSEQRNVNATLRRRIDAAYAPSALRLLAEHPYRPQCHLAQAIGHNGFGVSAGILQHFAVSACFETVATHEYGRGARYDWVLRMRTDMVLFAPLWLPVRRDRVYVPGGGMSYRSWLRCCNDHLFLCPRDLCHPYATLIHNFNRTDCRPLPGFAAGGDGLLPDGTIKPQPSKLAFAYHIARAYNATYNASQGSTCGRVVELGLVYAIARGGGGEDGEAIGAIDCEQNLRLMWSYEARALVPASVRTCADNECSRLSRRFARGALLNMSEVAKLNRLAIAAEARAGMHKAIAVPG